MKARSIVGCVAISLLAACGTQVDEVYPGEPLARLEGTLIAGEGDSGAADLDVGIIYFGSKTVMNDDGTTDHLDVLGGFSASVTGDFPARFQLTMYEPPPEEAHVTVEGSDLLVTIGYIVAGEPGSLEDPDGVDSRGRFDGLAGASPDHVVLWTSRAVRSDDAIAAETGPLDAGYHLFRVIPEDAEAREAWDTCFEGIERPEFPCVGGGGSPECIAEYDASYEAYSARLDDECGSAPRPLPELADDDENIEVVLGATPPGILVGLYDAEDDSEDEE